MRILVIFSMAFFLIGCAKTYEHNSGSENWIPYISNKPSIENSKNTATTYMQVIMQNEKKNNSQKFNDVFKDFFR